MYLDGAETMHNRPERNEDLGVRRKGLTIFTQTTRPISLITRDGEMSQKTVILLTGSCCTIVQRSRTI